MKKLLVLMLVLGMASLANADLQISVGGDKNPADSEYTLLPSEELFLDIWTDAVIPNLTGGTWMLVVDTTLGSITPGRGLLSPPQTVYGTPPYTAQAPLVIPPVGLEGIWGIYVAFGDIAAGTMMYDEIIFHCEALGDATIYLMDAPDGSPASIIYDSVVIHQVPEPMTVLLLGLGGLFLRRRKKQQTA